MKDPTLDTDTSSELDVVLKSVNWSNKTGILEANFTDPKFNFSMNEDDAMFEEILPKGEYKYHDPDGLMVAMLDDHSNFHMFVKDFRGLIHHKAVHLRPALRSIAWRKYNDWE